MKIVRFDKSVMHPAHGGTIFAQGVFEGQEIGAPFSCGFGLVKPGKAQEPESVPIAKIYYIREGHGHMTIGDETEEVREGDALFIPADTLHSIANTGDSDLGTFALWWEAR